MHAFHGSHEDGAERVELFAFHLARELGKTVAEIEAMPHREYAAWDSYFKSRNAVASVRGAGP